MRTADIIFSKSSLSSVFKSYLPNKKCVASNEATHEKSITPFVATQTSQPKQDREKEKRFCQKTKTPLLELLIIRFV